MLWSIFPNSLASSCELVIKVTDLQEIIKNQARVIENQAAVIGDLKQTTDHLTTGNKHDTNINFNSRKLTYYGLLWN